MLQCYNVTMLQSGNAAFSPPCASPARTRAHTHIYIYTQQDRPAGTREHTHMFSVPAGRPPLCGGIPPLSSNKKNGMPSYMISPRRGQESAPHFIPLRRQPAGLPSPPTVQAPEAWPRRRRLSRTRRRCSFPA